MHDGYLALNAVGLVHAFGSGFCDAYAPEQGCSKIYEGLARRAMRVPLSLETTGMTIPECSRRLTRGWTCAGEDLGEVRRGPVGMVDRVRFNAAVTPRLVDGSRSRLNLD